MARVPKPFTSALRWLPVVVGCVVLETAQPMSAEAEPAPRPAEDVIYPRSHEERPVRSPEGGGGAWLLWLAAALAAGGLWFWTQRRGGVGRLAGRGPQKLQVEETRVLGNRQYLIVASYEGRKLLLGVTPGRIDLLTRLSSEDRREGESP